MEGDEVRAALWPASPPPRDAATKNFTLTALLPQCGFMSELVRWHRTLNPGPEQPLTYSPHIYKASVLRCVALLPWGCGVWRVVAAVVVVVVIVGVTVVSPVTLRGAREFFVLYSFNNWFPFCTPQPHFLGAGSLILLLFKSNTSDYGVLPVHGAAKIRHKTEKEDSECELAGN